jgi:histone H3/H4
MKMSSDESTNQEILVVASKFKSYIKSKHQINTSANVMPKLSELIRKIADEAVERAKADGRKTLMDRDF